jgi:hypothetical protein
VGEGSSFLAVPALGNHGQPQNRGRIKICVPELSCREVMEHQSPKKLFHQTTSYCALQDPPTRSQCGRSPLSSPTFSVSALRDGLRLFVSFRRYGAPPIALLSFSFWALLLAHHLTHMAMPISPCAVLWTLHSAYLFFT